ncbi:MAG: hypothetical protein PHX87_03095 [Candidatus Peribacteraceae bacterium]|nr:hypothetical protein [Candidatus Peribacteraceae bacterium]MDD5742394.1 hypothetical protein [Candidatus Peribacteraceae bacterium]
MKHILQEYEQWEDGSVNDRDADALLGNALEALEDSLPRSVALHVRGIRFPDGTEGTVSRSKKGKESITYTLDGKRMHSLSLPEGNVGFELFGFIRDGGELRSPLTKPLALLSLYCHAITIPMGNQRRTGSALAQAAREHFPDAVGHKRKKERRAFLGEALSEQYHTLSAIAADSAMFVSQNPKADSLDTALAVFTDERCQALSPQQITGAVQALKDFFRKRRATGKWFPLLQKRADELIQHMFHLSQKVQGKVEVRRTMSGIHVILDDASFKLVDTRENVGGFVVRTLKEPFAALNGVLSIGRRKYDEQEVSLDSIFRSLAAVDTLIHETQHKYNDILMPEIQWDERLGRMEARELARAKGEILSYLSTGMSVSRIRERLTKRGGTYDYYNKSIEDVKTSGDVTKGRILAQQRNHHARVVCHLLAIAEKVRTPDGRIDLPLLAVTPAQHWEIYRQKSSTRHALRQQFREVRKHT